MMEDLSYILDALETLPSNTIITVDLLKEIINKAMSIREYQESVLRDSLDNIEQY